MLNSKFSTKNLETEDLNITEPELWKTAPRIWNQTLLLCLWILLFCVCCGGLFFFLVCGFFFLFWFVWVFRGFFFFFLLITIPGLWLSPNFPWLMILLSQILCLFYSLVYPHSKWTIRFLLGFLSSGRYLQVSGFRDTVHLRMWCNCLAF